MTPTASAATGALLSGLLALAAITASTAAAAGAVLLVVLALAAGWPRLLALPSPRGTSAVVAAAGLASAVAVRATTGPHGMRLLPPVLALAVLGAFCHQLLRRDLRPRVVDGLSGSVTGLLLAGLASGWLAALVGPGGAPLVVTGAVAAATGSLALLLPGHRAVRAGAAVAGALVGAGVVGALSAPAGLHPSLLLGLAVGVVLAAVQGVLALLPSARGRAAWASLGSAPVAACGLVVYAAGPVLFT